VHKELVGCGAIKAYLLIGHHLNINLINLRSLALYAKLLRGFGVGLIDELGAVTSRPRLSPLKVVSPRYRWSFVFWGLYKGTGFLGFFVVGNGFPVLFTRGWN
jgi:hypothetical protein